MAMVQLALCVLQTTQILGKQPNFDRASLTLNPRSRSQSPFTAHNRQLTKV